MEDHTRLIALPLKISAELFFKLGPCAIEPGFDGLLADTEHFGRLGLAETIDRPQHQGFAQPKRQPCYCGGGPGQFGTAFCLRIGEGGIVRHRKGFLERRGAGEKGAHPLPPRPIAALVERDPLEPDRERAFAVIAIERRECGDEDLLDDVERFVVVADGSANHAEHRCAMPGEQFAIGILPPAARQGREVRITAIGEREAHLFGADWASAVSALVTLLSNSAAWSGLRTARMAKRCSRVSFCISPMTIWV